MSTNREIQLKIRKTAEKQTKHLKGLKELKKCCYSCKHMRTLPGSKNQCRYTEKLINSETTSLCTHWEDAHLLQCSICHTWVRSLGNHVRHHGITASEYKQLNGYNKRTGLICQSTEETLKQWGQMQSEHLVQVNYILNGGTPTSTKGRHVSAEGRLNMIKAQQSSTKSAEGKARFIKSLKDNPRAKGIPKTDEHKNNLSKSHKERLKQQVNRKIVRDTSGRIVTYIDVKRKGQY